LITTKRMIRETNMRLPSVSSSRKAGLGSSLHFVSLRMTDDYIFEGVLKKSFLTADSDSYRDLAALAVNGFRLFQQLLPPQPSK
jgi:hypothetical protein